MNKLRHLPNRIDKNSFAYSASLKVGEFIISRISFRVKETDSCGALIVSMICFYPKITTYK